jgi:ubiquinol-cytochrome c reductase cytochrome b subunit
VPDAPGEVREPFTHHLRRLGALALILIGVLGVLAVLFPPAVGPAPVEGIEVTKPLWMFWWLYSLENQWGVPAILWGTGALFAVLVLVPFVDRSGERSWRKRRVAMALLALLALVLVGLTVATAFTSPASHLG